MNTRRRNERHAQNSFGARETLKVQDKEYGIYRLRSLEVRGYPVARLPYALKLLLENLLRHEDGVTVTEREIEALATWTPDAPPSREIAFQPARVLLQDFTGVPALVDLAAMRDAMIALGGDARSINPRQPVELVIDHSVQVDAFGSRDAITINEALDFQRNAERYALLRWAAGAFTNVTVMPPNTGIVHQVNLERLARVVMTQASADGDLLAFPDTLVGTDSHTPMVNGLGVLGWGVGGIEAEAAMLGQPLSLLLPEVLGVRLEGALPPGATATDLVLTLTELLRKKNVVGKFVEFFGPGLASLSVADRATVANMCPEYGATCAMFPVDEATLRYLAFTGRPREHLALVEAYVREQGMLLFEGAPDPEYSDLLSFNLSTVDPCVAGPRRPQDRVPLSTLPHAFRTALPTLLPTGVPTPTQKDAALGTSDDPNTVGVWGESSETLAWEPATKLTRRERLELSHGSVVLAAITSCTNTSNPSVMVAAGLLAKNAVRRGLRTRPWVKTSLAPGSRVVTAYLERGDLLPYLEALGFYVVGYGCTTCIGNSGPLPPEISEEISGRRLVVCSVLSGNRNFEGRINSDVRANFLMSPPLVVAFALAGHIDIDLTREPVGSDRQGRPVFLSDLWPTPEAIEEVVRTAVRPEMFRTSYAEMENGTERWNAIRAPEGDLFSWKSDSTYVRKPPYFEGMPLEALASVEDIRCARALAVLGDSITTDHISPAGSIRADSPAGRFLTRSGVDVHEFNSYGSRRGNHEVMVRGTFANARIRNRLTPDHEGGVTLHLPSGEVLPIYEAAVRYAEEKTPLVVLAGKEYGSGSSRDWAAKGPRLLGVRAVLAESYERIHRSNLVGMGILPLEFKKGQSVDSLGLSGREVFETCGLAEAVATQFAEGRDVSVCARREDGSVLEFTATIRVDTPQELLYLRHGGILPFVLRELLIGKEEALELKTEPAATPPTKPKRTSEGIVDEGSILSFPASDPPAH